jgi:hypothetical protein
MARTDKLRANVAEVTAGEVGGIDRQRMDPKGSILNPNHEF